MQIKVELREFWSKHLEHGDISRLAKTTGLSHSTISRIITGNIQKASSENVLKINALAKKRKTHAQKAELIED